MSRQSAQDGFIVKSRVVILFNLSSLSSMLLWLLTGFVEGNRVYVVYDIDTVDVVDMFRLHHYGLWWRWLLHLWGRSSVHHGSGRRPDVRFHGWLRGQGLGNLVRIGRLLLGLAWIEGSITLGRRTRNARNARNTRNTRKARNTRCGLSRSSTARARPASDGIQSGIDLPWVIRQGAIDLNFLLGSPETLEMLSTGRISRRVVPNVRGALLYLLVCAWCLNPAWKLRGFSPAQGSQAERQAESKTYRQPSLVKP